MPIAAVGRELEFNRNMDVGHADGGVRGDGELSRGEWNAYLASRTDLSTEQREALKIAFTTIANSIDYNGTISLAELNEVLGEKSLGAYANNLIASSDSAQDKLDYIADLFLRGLAP